MDGIMPISLSIHPAAVENNTVSNQSADVPPPITKKDCEDPFKVATRLAETTISDPIFGRFSAKPADIGKTTFAGASVGIWRAGYSRVVDRDTNNREYTDREKFEKDYPEGITELKAKDELIGYFEKFIKDIKELEDQGYDFMEFFFSHSYEMQEAIAILQRESLLLLGANYLREQEGKPQAYELVESLSPATLDYEKAVRLIRNTNLYERDPECAEAIIKRFEAANVVKH